VRTSIIATLRRFALCRILSANFSFINGNRYAIAFEPTREDDRYVAPTKKAKRTLARNMSSNVNQVTARTVRRSNSGRIAVTGSNSPSPITSKKERSDRSGRSGMSFGRSVFSLSRNDSSVSPIGEKIVQLLMTGVWIIKSIAPNMCEIVNVLRMEDS